MDLDAPSTIQITVTAEKKIIEEINKPPEAEGKCVYVCVSTWNKFEARCNFNQTNAVIVE